MGDYGSATFKSHYDDTGKVERVEVVEADPVIGISFEFLAQAEPRWMWIDSDGLLWLAGDYRYRYRPVRFDCPIGGLEPGLAVEGSRILICERVGD